VAAYLLGQVVVHDMEGFAPYVASATAAIVEHGGEVLDVVQAKETLEGTWPEGALTALVRFPDRESLERFWNSPENAATKALRDATSTSNVVIAESFGPR
jgi:uncharacterized protein (DUF1330 family)